MRKFIVPLYLLLALAAPAAAQVTTAPNRQGTTLPASCSNKLVVFNLTQADGANAAGLYRCNGTAYVSAGGATLPESDATAFVKGSADATKLLRFEVDGFTTGTTRVATFPDANITVARTDAGQTFAGAQVFSSTISTTKCSGCAQAAFAYKTAAQSIPYATWTSITWDAELDDTDAFHSTASNTSRLVVTAATAGKLTFTCHIGIDVNTTGPRAIRLYKNGTTIVHGPINFLPVTGDPTNMSFTVDVPDAANADYFECQVYQGNSGTGALNSTSGRAVASFSVRSY